MATGSLPFYLSLLLLLSPVILASLQEDEEASISRFQTYLKIDTAQPTPDYSKAAEFIQSQAKSLNLQSETLIFAPRKPLILLKWPGKNPSLPSILLNSHTDVVPAESHKWNFPPFSASIDSKTGKIYARGSQDMKSVGIQYLEAIRRLIKAEFEPERNIFLSFVPDEEIGGVDGVGEFVKCDKFGELNVGFVLDEGLPTEGEKFRVFNGERSPWWTVIKASGAPGHGAKLYDNSAMENMVKSLEVISKFRGSQLNLLKAGEKAEGDVVSVNFVYLKAGTPTPTGFVMNLQPSEAEAGLDIRVPPTIDEEALMRRIAEEWAPASRNMTFEFKSKVPVNDMYGKPAVTPVDSSNHWWALFEKAVKQAGGQLSKPEIFPASTDARYFRQRGLPAIGFSPISKTPSLLHDHNEYLGTDEYLKGIKIYESIIRALGSHSPGDTQIRDEL